MRILASKARTNCLDIDKAVCGKVARAKHSHLTTHGALEVSTGGYEKHLSVSCGKELEGIKLTARERGRGRWLCPVWCRRATEVESCRSWDVAATQNDADGDK